MKSFSEKISELLSIFCPKRNFQCIFCPLNYQVICKNWAEMQDLLALMCRYNVNLIIKENTNLSLSNFVVVLYLVSHCRVSLQVLWRVVVSSTQRWMYAFYQAFYIGSDRQCDEWHWINPFFNALRDVSAPLVTHTRDLCKSPSLLL